MTEIEKLTNKIDEDIDNEALCILIESIHDWRVEIYNLDQFYEELYNKLGSRLTKQGIEEHLISSDYLKNAWEVESISGLLELYNYFDHLTSIKEIFESFKNQYLT